MKRRAKLAANGRGTTTTMEKNNNKQREEQQQQESRGEQGGGGGRGTITWITTKYKASLTNTTK